MGAAAAIEKCTKDTCCPDELKILEPEQKEKEGSLFINDNNLISNNSINNDNNYNKQKQIFMFDHEEYNNEAKMDPNEFDDQNNFLGNPFKNEIEIINEDNDFFGSSNKSVFNSSNFSFKCLINNTNESIQKKLKMNKFAKTYCKNSTKHIQMNNDSLIYDLSQVKRIQRLYRTYLLKKKQSDKKTNFEDENDKEKNENENKNIVDKNKEDIKNYNNYNKIKIKSELTISKINIKNYSSLLLTNYLNDIDIIEVSEESFRSVITKSNKLQDLTPPQFNTRRDYDNDQVKGYFLLKKKMFKYQGKKDNEGKKVGFGKIVWEDSSKLKGYFSESKLNGIVYFYNCGNEQSKYFGEYVDNIPDGYGLYSRKGYSLEGMNWNKNNLNGIGVATWLEGEMYEGEFKSSAKEGIGVYRWVDGTSYMGYFKKNKINGIGRINFANGNSYEGEFNEGFLSGFGKFIWDDGKFYIGNYLKDKKHGFGLFVWSLEPLIALIGFWNQGKQNGICVKLYKGNLKIIFTQESKTNIEIHNRFDTSKYLLPNQTQFKNFFKKKYHEYEKFINFASKM